jgi:hypothetical protein
LKNTEANRFFDLWEQLYADAWTPGKHSREVIGINERTSGEATPLGTGLLAGEGSNRAFSWPEGISQ